MNAAHPDDLSREPDEHRPAPTTAADLRGESRRRRRRVLALLAVLAAAAYWALRPPTGHRPGLQGVIAATAQEAGHGGALDLATLTDFAWDRLHVFPAYSSDKDFSDGLGFDWTLTTPAGRALFGEATLYRLGSDGRQLLVFTRGERRVSGWCVLNEDWDGVALRFPFSPGAGPCAVYERAAARFEVQDVLGSYGPEVEAAWHLVPRTP